MSQTLVLYLSGQGLLDLDRYLRVTVGGRRHSLLKGTFWCPACLKKPGLRECGRMVLCCQILPGWRCMTGHWGCQLCWQGLLSSGSQTGFRG